MRREVIVPVRFSKEEYQYLREKAGEKPEAHFRNGGVNFSKFLRGMILEASGQKGSWLKAELRNISYQIRKIGVNVNQIAKKINSGYRGKEEAGRLEEHLRSIEQDFERLLEKLEEGYGYDNADAHKACK